MPTDTPIASIKVEMDVPWEVVTNAITGAIEGGSTYWCRQFMAASDDKSTSLYQSMRNSRKVWYDEREYWDQGGKAELKFDKPFEAHPGEATIDKDQLVKGLTVMAAKAPRHFADLINETDDATTHDVFLQYVLFAETIFG